MTGFDVAALRREGLKEAQRALAACLMAEGEAERGLATAEAEMWRKRDSAAALSDDDSAVEEFALWLPQGRRQVAAASAALERANAEVARARAMLSYVEGMPAIPAD